MSFPRYPKYKDSGVEWLGEVPEHWEIIRLKRAACTMPSNVDKKAYEGETSVLLCNYTDVYYNETITSALDFMPATASADQVAKFTLRAGDTVITKDSETADDIAIAAYVPADLPNVVCGYHLALIRPRSGFVGAFLKRLFDSVYVKSSVAVLANGLTRVGLGTYALDNLELPFPSEIEQRIISQFLDGETAKIDALVAEQQRLIELLRQKRHAVISETLARGLQSNAAKKSPYDEWLGDLPEGWEVVKLGACLKSAPCYGVLVPDYDPDGVPMLRIADMSGGHAARGNLTTISRALSNQYSRTLVEVGDVVLSVVGTIGEALTINDDLSGVNLSRAVARIQLASGLSPEYLVWIFQSDSFRRFVDRVCDGTAQKVLNMGDLVQFRLKKPPVEEQARICAFLRRTTEELDRMASAAERGISLLHERRSALISAAVTGKIDVRDYAAGQAEAA